MHTSRYPSVRFHQDGDFAGSVLVTAETMDFYDASPSSTNPTRIDSTVVSTHKLLNELLDATPVTSEYVSLCAPDSSRHSRFDVCDKAHERILEGQWTTRVVTFRRAELARFLLQARAFRAIRRMDRIADNMASRIVEGDSRADAFFTELEALAVQFDEDRFAKIFASSQK